MKLSKILASLLTFTLQSASATVTCSPSMTITIATNLVTDFTFIKTASAATSTAVIDRTKFTTSDASNCPIESFTFYDFST